MEICRMEIPQSCMDRTV